jgi:hypothetical protein
MKLKKRVLGIIFFAVVILILTSCSKEMRAFRKLDRAYELAPHIFPKDTVVDLFTPIIGPSIFELNCLESIGKTIALQIPRTYEGLSGEEEDTVGLTLTISDVGLINGQIDCPPPTTNTITVPVPYPVEKPLTEWQKFKISIPYMIASIGVLLVISIIITLFKKWIFR